MLLHCGIHTVVPRKVEYASRHLRDFVQLDNNELWESTSLFRCVENSSIAVQTATPMHNTGRGLPNGFYMRTTHRAESGDPLQDGLHDAFASVALRRLSDLNLPQSEAQ
jgi:hypothetical protein